MNTNLSRIMAIAFATLFLSAQAFACGGASKDSDIGKTDQNKYSMYDNSGFSESLSSDQDINKDQGSNNSQPTDQNETSEPETFGE